MPVSQDPELIARLEQQATRRPGLYRFWLALLAVAGDFTLTIVEVAPWFAVVFFGVVIANRPFFYWMGAVALVFLIWLLRPTFRIKGRELRKAEAPEMFGELEILHRRLRVPGAMQVLLDEEFNASATETRGLFGVLGTCRVLTLGIPLLAILSREGLIAVIAHEFGHFSRRHGRLGHWLYRARVGWMKYAEYVEESDSAFDRAAAWYAKRFVPYFSARSFVHSRQCEYEADADAALVVGSKVFSGALSRIAVIAKLWNEIFPRQLAQWQLDSLTPPSDFHERFAEAAKNSTLLELQPWLDEAMAEQSSWSDTHPSLSARLNSLKEQPFLTSPHDNAGASLLGETWVKVLAEFDAKWSKQVQIDWALEHFRLRHITQELIAADEQTVKIWHTEKQLARARALRPIDPAKGLKELRSLYERNPTDQRIAFACAAALLNENDSLGVEVMERLAKDNPVFRLAAYLRLLAYCGRKGDTEQIDRYSARAKLAARRQQEAFTSFLTSMENGGAAVSSLPTNVRRVLADSINLDRCVAMAWLLEGSAQLPIAINQTSIPVLVHALVLTVDPKALDRYEEDESDIAERYERALTSLLPPDQIGGVRTYFITENIPAIFAPRSDYFLTSTGAIRQA